MKHIINVVFITQLGYIVYKRGS